MLRRAPALGLMLVLLALPGCVRFGPQILGSDHLDYARALSEAQKRETLFNVVRLRYGDVPVFLSTTQVISGYSLEAGAEAGVSSYPGVPHSSFVNAQGTLDFANHPTFTFTPVTGESFADSYIRPLSPIQLLPLAQSGLPVDVLLRLGVQAIGELQNSSPLGGAARAGSPDFFRLLGNLRALQVANALSLRLQRPPGAPKEAAVRVFFLLAARNDPDLRRVADETRRLLGLDPGANEFEVIYGHGRTVGNRVAILTRSILAMLIEVGSQIEVPKEDVAAGRTLATVHPPAPNMTPVITIHNGADLPSATFVSLYYRGRWYWVDDVDFRSKAALSVLELLHSIAESGKATQAPVITIPVG